MKKLLTKDQVCELLAISSSTLDRIVADGDLQRLKVRGQIRFLEEDLLQYLSTCGEDKRPAPQPEPRKRYKRPMAPRKPRSIPPEELPPQLRYIPGMKVV